MSSAFFVAAELDFSCSHLVNSILGDLGAICIETFPLKLTRLPRVSYDFSLEDLTLGSEELTYRVFTTL